MSSEVSTWQIPSFDSRKVESKGLSEAEKIKGFEQGYQEGLEKGKAEYAQRLKTLEDCISKLPDFNTYLNESHNQIVMDFVQKTLLKSMQYELKNSSDFLKVWISKGIAYLQDQSSVQLLMNPEQLKELEGPLRDYMALKKIECIPDPKVSLCQIILKTPTETISSKLDEWTHQSLELNHAPRST